MTDPTPEPMSGEELRKRIIHALNFTAQITGGDAARDTLAAFDRLRARVAELEREAGR